MEVDGLDSVCAGLGCVSQDPRLSYVKSEHCLENLKNLQRFLRRDNPTSRPVFKQLGKWNTVGRDLVPMIVQYRDDPQLIINAVKVVVFLTMPVDALSENISQQLDYLLDFKASFLHNDAIAVIMTLLEEPLEHLESHSFSEDDWKVVQLVLTLMRNLLDIQDMSLQKLTANEITRGLSIRDNLLEHLFEENVMDLLLALAQHISGPAGLLRQDSVLFLEIFHHIFWGQSPEKIARANGSKALDKRSKQPAGLLRVITEEEQEGLKDLRLKDLSRHSRFSGSFVRLSEDGSRKMLKRNPFQSSIDAVLMGPQVKHGPVKRIACDKSSLMSEGRVLELLKTFADQVLLGSYNVVMQSVKDDIRKERNWIQTADVALFFEVAKFFTAYQRCSFSTKKVESRKEDSPPTREDDCLFQGYLCGPIASTMDQDMFAMVVSRWHAYSEAAKETNDWTSLSITGSLFKEMVRMLDLVLKDAKDKSGSERQEARVTRILLYKIFYDQTEQGTFQFLLHLLKSFDIHKQPRSHLADLVETVHVVLRTIEFLTKEDGALRVLKKSRKSNKFKTKSKGLEHEQSQSGKVLASNLNDVDSNAKVIADDQLLGDSDSHIVEDNLGTSNECTNVENVNMASLDSGNELETTITELVFIVKPVEVLDMISEGIPSVSEKDIQITAEKVKESDNESEQEGANRNVEVSLNVQRCASMFAENTVIRNYCWLLSFFMTNTASVNHYIISMLQRICKDHSLEPMLFQLSLFQIFYEILSNRKATKIEEHKRIFAFLTKLTRNFFKKLKAQPLLFLDVLFWKTRQECHLITTDYKIQSLRKTFGKSAKNLKKTSIADALGNDEAEIDPYTYEINQSEADPDASEFDRSENKVETSSRAPLTMKKTNRAQKNESRKKREKFTEKREAQLIELFEQYKDNPKCCHLLAQEIDPEGTIKAAQVRRRLKALNLTPMQQRRRVRKGGECQTDGSKPKGSKRCKQDLHVETSMDGLLSDDETLSQLIEKVRGGSSLLSKGRKKRGSDIIGEHGKEMESENEDETLKDHLAMRKRARRKGGISRIVDSSFGIMETRSQEPECSIAQDILEKSILNRLEREPVEVTTMHVDEMVKDNVGSEDMELSLQDDDVMITPSSSSSPLASVSAGRRRRTLFTVDDDDDDVDN